MKTSTRTSLQIPFVIGWPEQTRSIPYLFHQPPGCLSPHFPGHILPILTKKYLGRGISLHRHSGQLCTLVTLNPDNVERRVSFCPLL